MYGTCENCGNLDKTKKKDYGHKTFMYGCSASVDGYITGGIHNDNELKNLGCSTFIEIIDNQLNMFSEVAND